LLEFGSVCGDYKHEQEDDKFGVSRYICALNGIGNEQQEDCSSRRKPQQQFARG
jgi:hypothetical protein